MAEATKAGGDRPSARSRKSSATGAAARPPSLEPSVSLDTVLEDGSDALLRGFIWDVFSLSSHMEALRDVWARLAGVSGPQWLILMAIDTLDEGGGVSVTQVADKIHVNSTFVTTQSKALEAAGYVDRAPSPEDRRFVLLALTAHARERIDAFAETRRRTYDSIFETLPADRFRQLSQEIAALRDRFERGQRIVRAEIGD